MLVFKVIAYNMAKNGEIVYISNTIFKLMTKLMAVQIAKLIAEPIQYLVTYQTNN